MIEFNSVSKPPSKIEEPQVAYAPTPAPESAHVNHVSAEIDMSQLEHNLSLTPEQRLVEHQNALELVLALEAAGRRLRDQSE